MVCLDNEIAGGAVAYREVDRVALGTEPLHRGKLAEIPLAPG
jgi:hypothetical protein